MKNKTWFSMAAEKGKATISIYDEIGGWGVSAKGFRESLAEMGDISEIELRLNSPGGSVIDGFAIYNMLREHPAKVVAKIDGWAASMASIIAMAADVIEMPSNTWMMIHNPWTVAVGEADDLKRMAEILEKMENHALVAYQMHSTLAESEIKQLMNDETWMDGADAVEKGFADVLTDELEIAASVTGKKELNAPEAAMVWCKGEKMDEEKKDEVIDEPAVAEETNVDAAEVESDTTDGTELEPAAEKEVIEEVKEDAPEGAVKEKFDAAYDEGEAAGFERGKKEGETNAIAELAKLQDATDELQGDYDDTCVALETVEKLAEAKDAEIADLKGRLDKLTGGLSSEVATAEPQSFREAVKACGYEEARGKYPELYKADREYNKQHRRDK